MKKISNKDGFTLVELILVIAIIGILAVIAVPSLFNSINMAKITKLEADINAVKTASIQYEMDKGKLPSWDKTNSTNSDFLDYIDGISSKSPIGGDYSLYHKSENSPSILGNLYTYKEDKYNKVDPNGSDFGRLLLGIQNADGLNVTEKQVAKLVEDIGSDRVYLAFFGDDFESGTYYIFIKLM